MQVETALFFETVEEIYARVFRTIRPHAKTPRISVKFRRYANANSRIKLEADRLTVSISDLLERAPAPIQEALASVLVSKLFRKKPDQASVARFRRYINGSHMRELLYAAKRERGRKVVRDPQGKFFDLEAVFGQVNREYFSGSMKRPVQLGWSVKISQTTLGHYDPSHDAIVISSLLDSEHASELIVRYVMFHEMLHIRYPAKHIGAKRCIHTREFKEAEKRFANYAEAKSALKRFLTTAGAPKQSEAFLSD